MSKVLIAAIDANDPDAVRKALKGIKDINRKLPGADKPILYAAKKGADKVLAPLFEAGAIAEKRHTFPGDTPFAVAVKHHHGKVLEQLLALKKPSKFVVDHIVRNAMMDNDPAALDIILRVLKLKLELNHYRGAVQDTGTELVKILLQYGGSPQARFDSQRAKDATIFHELVGSGGTDLIKLLLEHGAEINSRDGSGCTPLMTLAAKLESFDHHNESVQFKLQAIANGTAKPGPAGPPKLLDALEFVELLLQAGADATLEDEDGNDALDHYVFKYYWNRKEPVAAVRNRLVRAGAKGNQATIDLFEALKQKDSNGVRKAIANGADVNRQTPQPYRHTPLGYAAWSSTGDPFVYVNILLEAGANPNKPAGKSTPLINAVRSGNLEVTQALIAAGADIHYVCEDGESIENAYSAAEGKNEVRAYLKSLGTGNPKRAKFEPIKPGVESWNDFSELLIKTTVAKAAETLAKLVNGKVTLGAYGKTFSPGKHAYVVARPKCLAWCNVFQIAPPRMRFEDSGKAEKFARELAKTSGAPVLSIEYSDTSDAASVFLVEADGKSTKDAGWDNDILEEMTDAMGDEAPDWAKKQLANADEDDLNSTERLKQLAEREKFVVAAFGFCCDRGQKLEIEITGYGPEHFDDVAFISD